jgi:D-alanyl-D-alanine dipeptidase
MKWSRPEDGSGGGARHARSRARARGARLLLSLLVFVASPGCSLAAPLVDVRTLDPSLRIEVRYATPSNFTGAPLPGYEAPRVLLHRQVAAALVRVQRRLRPRGLGLLLYDGYRPVRATQAMVAWAERQGRQDLLEGGYIARRSRHNLGVAVDLTVIDLGSGVPLDMGTVFDEFSPAAHTTNATGEVLAHRRVLVEAMEAEGFRNLPEEWWHFSYEVPAARPLDVPIRR